MFKLYNGESCRIILLVYVKKNLGKSKYIKLNSSWFKSLTIENRKGSGVRLYIWINTVKNIVKKSTL